MYNLREYQIDQESRESKHKSYLRVEAGMSELHRIFYQHLKKFI